MSSMSCKRQMAILMIYDKPTSYPQTVDDDIE